MENPGLERFSSVSRDETPENYIKVSYRRTAIPMVQPKTMDQDPPVNPVQPLDVTRRDNISTPPPATGVTSPDPVSSANGAPAMTNPAADAARIVRQKQPGGGSSQENPEYDRAHNGPGGVEDKVWARRNAALNHPLHQGAYDRERHQFLYDLDHPEYPYADRTTDMPPSYISETSQPMFQLKDAHPYHGISVPGGDDTIAHGDESWSGDKYSEDADLRARRDALKHTSMANDWGVAEGTPGRFEYQDPEPDAKRFSSHVQRLGDGRYGWMSREANPQGKVFARGVTDNMLDAMGRAELNHGLMKAHPEFSTKPSGYRGKRRRASINDHSRQGREGESCETCWLRDGEHITLEDHKDHDQYSPDDPHKFKPFEMEPGQRFSHHEPMQDIKDTIAIQGNDGNWDYSPYMHGMFNGMELQNSIVEGREPEFREAPDTYLEDKATWRPAKPGETPGQVEPDDAPAVEPRLASRHSALYKKAEEDDYIHWPGDDGDAYSSVPSDDEWGQHGLEEHERPQGITIGEHERLVDHGFRYDLDDRHPSYHRSIPRDMPDGTWATENHTIERNPRVERGDIEQGTGGRNAITFPWSHSYTAAGDTDENTLHRGHNSFAGALGASNVLSLKGPEHSEGKKVLEGYSKW